VELRFLLTLTFLIMAREKKGQPLTPFIDPLSLLPFPVTNVSQCSASKTWSSVSSQPLIDKIENMFYNHDAGRLIIGFPGRDMV
jgi:hypothetical protein